MSRAHQMLTVLDAIVPLYLRQLVGDKKSDMKETRLKRYHLLSRIASR